MPHAHASAAPSLIALVVMWFGMMAVMMAPTVWPWVRAFDRLGHAGRSPMTRAAATASFSGGYLTAWLGYAAAAAGVQTLLLGASGLDSTRGGATVAGGAILVIAGLFQFSSFKHGCLMHCRNPIAFFLARWRDGAAGGFRMGFGHGVFCVGCCWALMATALATGMTNLWWMAGLTVVAFVEQVAPRGHLLRVPLGVALVIAGILRWPVN
jgi:predicted metal-binding membrane protein